MNNLTLCDWQLALAAYAYENTSRLTMTDASYERMSADAKARGTRLPGFLDYTGSWIGEMDGELVKRVLEEAWSRNDGKDDLHGPAIGAALEACGITYGCCVEHTRGIPCWKVRG